MSTQSVSIKTSLWLDIAADCAQYVDEQVYLSGARTVTPIVYVYFEDGTQIFYGNDILSFELLEEANVTGGSPLGFVSANEFSVALNNSKRSFVPNKDLFPERTDLYEIHPGIRIKPWVQITDAHGSSSFVPLGEFWCGEWDAPTDSLEVKTTAYDRLMELITTDTPQIPVMTNTTIGQMCGRLFRALGLSWGEFIISPALTQKVKVGWFPRDKVGQSLQLLAEAGNCYISVNRNNQVVVMPNTLTSTPKGPYTDRESVFSINNPQKFLDMYTAVKVIYRLPYLKDPDHDLVRADRILIPPGTTVLDRIDFKADDIPVMQVDWVHAYGAYNLKEIQHLFLGEATGGTFRVGRQIIFKPVAACDFDAHAPTIVTNAATNVIPYVDCTLTGEPPYIYTNQSAIKAPSASISVEGISLSINVVAEVLTVEWSDALPYHANAGEIQAALELLYGVGNVEVVLTAGVFIIEFALNVKRSFVMADFYHLTGAVDPYLAVYQRYVPDMRSKVTAISYGATDVTLTVENDSDYDEEINIRIKGIGTGFHASHRITADSSLVTKYGYKEFSQDNPLVQDRAMAEVYSSLILSYLSDPLNTFIVDLRTDPEIEIGSTITIESATDQITAVDVVPHSIKTTFDGSLKSYIVARRAL